MSDLSMAFANSQYPTIGITGHIGSGKSYITKLMESWGWMAIDADSLGRQLLETNLEVQKQVIQLFGPSILNKNKIDRSKLRELVFVDDPKPRLLIQNIIHPPVLKEMLRLSLNLDPRKKGIVYESALWIDLHMTDSFDALWIVDAPLNLCEERLKKERGLTTKEIQSIMKSQLATTELKRSPDLHIINDGRQLETNVKEAADLIIKTHAERHALT